MEKEARSRIQLTKQWVEKAVIGLNLCPFLKIPWQEGRVQTLGGPINDLDSLARQILNDLNQDKFETSLLVLNESPVFSDFYKLFGHLEDSLAQLGLDQQFQLVAFHPEFVFEGLHFEDLANLVNRSPFPTLHFLKKESLAKLELSPKQGTEISLKNEEVLKSLPLTHLKEIFPWNF